MEIGGVYICTNCAEVFSSDEDAAGHIAAAHAYRDSPYRGGD